MATSTLTLSSFGPGSSIDQRTIDYYFTVVIGAGDYATGGLACSFSGKVRAPGSPLEVRVYSAVDPAAAAAFVYHYAPDSDDQNGGMLQIFTGAAAQSGLAELAAGATPSGVTGDTIRMIAKFAR